MAKDYRSYDPCICCGLTDSRSVCFHHIMTRGAYPEFSECEWNMIPVCKTHHNEFHYYGTSTMAIKYYPVKDWLDRNQWEFDKNFRKWLNPQTSNYENGTKKTMPKLSI